MALVKKVSHYQDHPRQSHHHPSAARAQQLWICACRAGSPLPLWQAEEEEDPFLVRLHERTTTWRSYSFSPLCTRHWRAFHAWEWVTREGRADACEILMTRRLSSSPLRQRGRSAITLLAMSIKYNIPQRRLGVRVKSFIFLSRRNGNIQCSVHDALDVPLAHQLGIVGNANVKEYADLFFRLLFQTDKLVDCLWKIYLVLHWSRL